jgi:hypothetical protein
MSRVFNKILKYKVKIAKPWNAPQGDEMAGPLNRPLVGTTKT